MLPRCLSDSFLPSGCLTGASSLSLLAALDNGPVNPNNPLQTRGVQEKESEKNLNVMRR